MDEKNSQLPTNTNNKRLSIRDFAEGLQSVFKGDIIGKEVVFYESTASTNDRAIEIGRQIKDPEGIVVIADAQSRGRGRMGRSWVSPPGVNLYFTVLLKPPVLPKEALMLTLMAAVAVASAIREYVGLKAEIRWPNDILVRNKKIGGVLTEMRTDMGRVNFVAVGIGVNVNMSLSLLPEEVRLFATSLKRESGRHINRVQLLGEMLSKLEYWYKTFLRRDKRALIDEWRCLDSTIGNKIRVKMVDFSRHKGSCQKREMAISGIAEGIDGEGQLIVRLPSGALERVSAGDVTILKDKVQL